MMKGSQWSTKWLQYLNWNALRLMHQLSSSFLQQSARVAMCVTIVILCNETCDTCMQASPEIDLERKKSQDLGENRTHNLNNSSVTALPLSYQDLGIE